MSACWYTNDVIIVAVDAEDLPRDRLIYHGKSISRQQRQLRYTLSSYTIRNKIGKDIEPIKLIKTFLDFGACYGNCYDWSLGEVKIYDRRKAVQSNAVNCGATRQGSGLLTTLGISKKWIIIHVFKACIMISSPFSH